MPIEEAREKIIEKLKRKGLLVKIDENYIHNVAVNYRGKGFIEPQIMKQWFIDVNKKIVSHNNKSLKELREIAIDQYLKNYIALGLKPVLSAIWVAMCVIVYHA